VGRDITDVWVVWAALVLSVISRLVAPRRRTHDRVGSAQDHAPALENMDSDTSYLYKIKEKTPSLMTTA